MSDRRDYSTIIEALKAGITPHLEEIIQKKVNGKIDRIDKRLDGIQTHLDNIDIKLQKLKPVSDSIITIQNLKRFINWLGVSMLVAIAWIWYKLK